MKPLLLFVAFLLPFTVVGLPFVDFIHPGLLTRNVHLNHDVVYENAEESSKDDSGGCNWGTMQYCLARFITESGLGAYNTMNATYLKMAVNQFLADGAQQGPTGAANNLFKLCRAQQDFYGQCLGWNQVDQCVSAIEFIRQGNTSNDGFGYQMLFTRLNFQCGVEFTAFINHPMEVAQTPANQATALDNCSNTFINQLSDPNVKEFCGPMEQYGECIGKIYTTAANGNVDLGWSVCEATRLANIITLPLCTDTKWTCKLANLQ